MTLREALIDIMGPDLYESITADMGLEWTIVAALAQVEAEHVNSEASRQLIEWNRSG